MYEFSQVNEVALAQVQDREEALANDARQVRVRQQGDFVYAFRLVIGLCDQVLEDVFKVWYGHVFLEFFIAKNFVVDKLEFVCLIALHLSYLCVTQLGYNKYWLTLLIIIENYLC